MCTEHGPEISAEGRQAGRQVREREGKVTQPTAAGQGGPDLLAAGLETLALQPDVGILVSLPLLLFLL